MQHKSQTASHFVLCSDVNLMVQIQSLVRIEHVELHLKFSKSTKPNIRNIKFSQKYSCTIELKTFSPLLYSTSV